MDSFRSRHYPLKKKRWRIFQEQAMRHYAILASIVMLITLVRMVQHKEILMFTLLGLAIGLGIANLMAVVSLRRQVAEVFILQEHFAVLSVYDILFEQETRSFPLIMASPARENDHLSFHYFDRIITLKAGDWENFDLLSTHLIWRSQG